MSRNIFTSAKRIVIKIGSSLIVDEDKQHLRDTWLHSLADDLAHLKEQGKEVILVSSGAIAVGRKALGDNFDRTDLAQKQAAASIGQILLAHYYQDIFQKRNINVGQVLLTSYAFKDTEHKHNAKQTLDKLLSLGVIPIINENDAVATQEIRFGDNDKLSAQVAALTKADALILLSDVDGLYSADPRKDKDAAFIRFVVGEITDPIKQMAGSTNSSVGTGGMASKIAAAEICLANDITMSITCGKDLNPISKLFDEKKATWFLPSSPKKVITKKEMNYDLKGEGKTHE